MKIESLGLALMVCLATNIVRAASFDLDALKRLPDIAALEAGCAPPILAYAVPLPTSDLLAEAQKLPEDRRALAWLLDLHRRIPDRMAPQMSIAEPADPLLDRFHAALTTAGLEAKAAALAGATRSATAIADLRFANLTLPQAFGTKADLAADIVAYARRTPALAACLDAAHTTMSDAARLSVLVEGLIAGLGTGADPKALPPPYRIVWLSNQYVGEVDNGGLEQLFSNAGPDAPETVLALRAIGRPAQADLVARGIAMFGLPFPTDRERLQAREQELGLGDKLDAMTPDADTKSVGEAMAVYGRGQDILPR